MYNDFVCTLLIIPFFSCQWHLIGGRGPSPNNGVTPTLRYMLYQFKLDSNLVYCLEYSSSSTTPQQQPRSCSTKAVDKATGGESSKES